MELKDGIKRFRSRMNFKTQRDLAEVLNISQENVSAWEVGRAFPSFQILKKLMELGATTEELFDIKSEQNISGKNQSNEQFGERKDSIESRMEKIEFIQNRVKKLEFEKQNTSIESRLERLEERMFFRDPFISKVEQLIKELESKSIDVEPIMAHLRENS